MGIEDAALLEEARGIAWEAGRRAAEIEAGRHVPRDLVERLRRAGVFGLFVPRALGGREAELGATVRLLETLARGDASTAWIAMQGHHAAVLPSGMAAYREVYADGADVIWANSMVPAGRMTRADGGWRVTGRWPFASGCGHADWLFGLAFAEGDPDGPAGHPAPRGIAAPASAWTVEDTWDAAGLRGTGSHHVRLDDVFIPDAQAFAPFAGGPPAFDDPVHREPMLTMPLQFAAIAVGIAQGALDDIAAMAVGGRAYTFSAPLRDSPVFHHELAKADTELRAARALLHAQAEELWEASARGAGPDLHARAGAARTWIAAAAARVTDACYGLGGAAAVSAASPLQRRLRDVHAVTQHITLNPRQYAIAGEALAGLPPRPPLG